MLCFVCLVLNATLPFPKGLRPGRVMLSRISVRAQATAAAAAPNTLASSFDLRGSRLPSGLSVTSVDLGQPIAHLAIAFRAGSRYQSAAEAGFVHRLRNAIGTDSRRAKGVTMLWQSGIIGADVQATADRENLIVTMSLPRTHAALGASLLSELAQPKLEPWDLEEANAAVKTDVAHLPTWEKVSQLLHEAAFRNGPLSQAPLIVCPHAAAAGANFRALQDYANSRLVAREGSVVGVNVDHGELASFFAEKAYIQEAAGRGDAPQSQYYGHGDARRAASSASVGVAVAGEAASLADSRGLAAAAVVAQLIKKALPSASAFYQPYGDAGLIGFYLEDEASAQTTDKIKAAVNKLRSLADSVNDTSVEAAKAAARNAVLVRADRGAELASSLAASVLSPAKDLHSPADVAGLIDGVSVADVKEGARKAGAQLSLGAVGNTRLVPYLDEC